MGPHLYEKQANLALAALVTAGEPHAPIFNIGTPRQSMAYDHAIVSLIIQFAPSFVCDLHILQDVSILQLEVVNSGYLLRRYQLSISV